MTPTRRQRIFAALGCVALLFSACGSKEELRVASAPPIVPAPLATPTPEPAKERPVYVYSGDRFRDPFVPAGQTGSYQPDAIFDPQKAILRGIVFGNESRGAVLSSGGGGTYFIKAGRIFDIMGKTVEGFSAKVLVDRVLITGDADNVFELKIRNQEEKSL